MSRDEDLFIKLQDRAEIAALIGKTEDLYLDCKTWPTKEEDGQRVLAKALCGFANASGGVIVVGMSTKKAQKGDPDLITVEQPLNDAIAVKARIETLVGDLVEPGVKGVELAAVPDQAS